MIRQMFTQATAGAMLLACVGVAQADGQVSVATQAGVFGKTIQASQFNLQDYQGKVVYLDFWASWCGPCRKSFPWMESIHKKYSSDKFAIVAINVDEDTGEFNKFMNYFNPTMTVVRDASGAIASKYDLIGMPSSFIIDQSGKVVVKHAGFRDADKARLEQQIEALIK